MYVSASVEAQTGRSHLFVGDVIVIIHYLVYYPVWRQFNDAVADSLDELVVTWLDTRTTPLKF